MFYGKYDFNFRLGRYLKWLARFFVAAGYFFQIYFHLMPFFSSKTPSIFITLLLLANLMHISLLFTLYLLHDRKFNIEIIASLKKLSPYDCNPKTLWLTLICILTCFVGLTIDFAGTIINATTKDKILDFWPSVFGQKGNSFVEYIIADIIWNVYINGWMLFDTIHFGLVIYLFCKCKQNLLGIALKNRNVRILKNQVSELLELKERIEKKLTLAPFVWFFDLFIRVSCRIAFLALQTDFQNPIFFVTMAKEAVVQLVPQFGLVLAMSSWNSNCISCNCLMSTLTNGKVENEHLFLQKMLENLEKGFRIWGVFSLEKSLIVSFASGVVTFTVMIIQLMEPLIDRSKPVNTHFFS